MGLNLGEAGLMTMEVAEDATYGGLVIKVDEIANRSSSIATEITTQQSNIDTMISNISTYEGTSGLEGSAWTENKLFFTETHVAFLNLLLAANQELVTSYQTFQNKTGTEDLSERELEEDIATYSALVEQYSAAVFNFHLAAKPHVDSPADRADAVNGLKENNAFLNAAQQKLEELRRINESARNDLDNAYELQTKINEMIVKIARGWENSEGKAGFNNSLPNTGLFKEIETRAYYAEAIRKGFVKVDKKGNVTYDWPLIEDYLQEKKPEELTNEDCLALVQTMECIVVNKDEKNLEKFLNAAYVKERVPAPNAKDRTNVKTPMDSYGYFAQERKSKTEFYYRTTLSPVFKELPKYYTNHVVTDEYLERLYSGQLSQHERDLAKDKLLCAGIFNDVSTYGDNAYSTSGDGYYKVKVLKLDKDKELCEMKITQAKGKTVHIKQYAFADEENNVDKVIDSSVRFLEDKKTTGVEYIGNAVTTIAAGLITAGSGPIGAVVTGTELAVDLMASAACAYNDNNEYSYTQKALKMSRYAEALGIEGQICVVDDEMKYQYINVNEDILATNLGAYNSVKSNDISIEDLKTDPKKLEKFTDFCGAHDEAIDRYKDTLNGRDPKAALSEKDQKALSDVPDALNK